MDAEGITPRDQRGLDMIHRYRVLTEQPPEDMVGEGTDAWKEMIVTGDQDRNELEWLQQKWQQFSLACWDTIIEYKNDVEDMSAEQMGHHSEYSVCLAPLTPRKSCFFK